MPLFVCVSTSLCRSVSVCRKFSWHGSVCFRLSPSDGGRLSLFRSVSTLYVSVDLGVSQPLSACLGVSQSVWAFCNCSRPVSVRLRLARSGSLCPSLSLSVGMCILTQSVSVFRGSRWLGLCWSVSSVSGSFSNFRSSQLVLVYVGLARYVSFCFSLSQPASGCFSFISLFGLVIAFFGSEHCSKNRLRCLVGLICL